MEKSMINQILLEELERINANEWQYLKLIYAQGEEIKHLWDEDFPVRDMRATIQHDGDKVTAYALTRITPLSFYLYKVTFRYFWVETDVKLTDKKIGKVTTQTEKVRTNTIIYEDMPVNILVAQQVLTLRDYRLKNISEWYYIFDELVKFIKMSPSGINGKVLPNFQNLISHKNKM